MQNSNYFYMQQTLPIKHQMCLCQKIAESAIPKVLLIYTKILFYPKINDL